MPMIGSWKVLESILNGTAGRLNGGFLNGMNGHLEASLMCLQGDLIKFRLRRVKLTGGFINDYFYSCDSRVIGLYAFSEFFCLIQFRQICAEHHAYPGPK